MFCLENCVLSRKKEKRGKERMKKEKYINWRFKLPGRNKETRKKQRKKSYYKMC